MLAGNRDPRYQRVTNARTALFVLEAGPVLGIGHALRCLALADALADTGWSCAFAVNPGFERSVPMPLFDRHAVVEAAADAAWTADALKATWPSGVTLAVVDHYGLAADFEADLRSWALKRLIIDDLLDRPHDGDALLCVAPPPSAGQGVAADTETLFGPQYALIRSEFVEQQTVKLLRPAPRREQLEVLISLGGSVQANRLRVCLDALGLTRRPLNVTVIGDLGEEDPQALADRFSQMSVTVHRMTSEMARLMAGADLIVGACGHSSWERAALAAPTVALVVASNQARVADTLESSKAALVLRNFDRMTPETLKQRLMPLLESAEARVEMGGSAAALCDGRGARRSAISLDPERDKLERTVKLRSTRWEDREMLHDWQRHAETRRYADNPEVPASAEHEAWLASKLRCPKTLLETVTCDGKPAASVRLDLQLVHDAPSRVVSIYTAPDEKQRGVAGAALRAARRLVPEQPFFAKVDPRNVASRRLFASAGYRQVDVDWYKSDPVPAAGSNRDSVEIEQPR